jgi:hypothetical protein
LFILQCQVHAIKGKALVGARCEHNERKCAQQAQTIGPWHYLQLSAQIRRARHECAYPRVGSNCACIEHAKWGFDHAPQRHACGQALGKPIDIGRCVDFGQHQPICLVELCSTISLGPGAAGRRGAAIEPNKAGFGAKVTLCQRVQCPLPRCLFCLWRYRILQIEHKRIAGKRARFLNRACVGCWHVEDRAIGAHAVALL